MLLLQFYSRHDLGSPGLFYSFFVYQDPRRSHDAVNALWSKPLGSGRTHRVTMCSGAPRLHPKAGRKEGYGVCLESIPIAGRIAHRGYGVQLRPIGNPHLTKCGALIAPPFPVRRMYVDNDHRIVLVGKCRHVPPRVMSGAASIATCSLPLRQLAQSEQANQTNGPSVMPQTKRGWCALSEKGTVFHTRSAGERHTRVPRIRSAASSRCV